VLSGIRPKACPTHSMKNETSSIEAAGVASQKVHENMELLELLDVTPPYFALQDLRTTDMVRV
jgi:hypothetical protein